MKYLQKLFLSGIVITLFFSITSPKSFAQEEDQSYLDCLCRCACTEEEWDCNSVNCYYDTTNECKDPTFGECYCGGFECGRASINESGSCAKECDVYRTDVQCIDLEEAYNKTKRKYNENLQLFQILNNYEDKAIALYVTNNIDITLLKVYEYLEPDSSKLNDSNFQKIESIFLKGSIPDKHSLVNDTEIKAAILRIIRETRNEIDVNNIIRSAIIDELYEIKEKNDSIRCAYVFDISLFGVNKSRDTALTDINPDTKPGMIIYLLKKRGVIKGYDNGSFQPKKEINRSEFLKILMESQHSREMYGEDCFHDVQNQWFAKYVCTAKKEGIINGYSDGTFRPENSITIVEALKIVLESTRKSDILFGNNYDNWWEPYYMAAIEHKILPSDITHYSQVVDRSQMAEIIFRAIFEDKIFQEDIWSSNISKEDSLIDIGEFKDSEEKNKNILFETLKRNHISENYIPFNKLFLDKGLGYKIHYPDNFAYSSYESSTVVFYGPVEKSFFSRVTVTIQKFASKQTGGEFESLYDLVENLKTQIFKLNKAKIYNEWEYIYKISEEKELVSKEFIAEYSYKDTNYKKWQIVIPSKDETQFFVWSYTSTIDLYNTYLDDIKKILATWEFLD